MGTCRDTGDLVQQENGARDAVDPVKQTYLMPCNIGNQASVGWYDAILVARAGSIAARNILRFPVTGSRDGIGETRPGDAMFKIVRYRETRIHVTGHVHGIELDDRMFTMYFNF